MRRPGLGVRVLGFRGALWLLCLALLGFLPISCRQVRPTARYGLDLLENSERNPVTRTFSGIGAALGHVLAFPVSLALLPTYPFEDQVVLGPDGYPELYTDADGGPLDPEVAKALYPDVYLPLVVAPYEYGSGLGAAILGGPFEALSRAFSDDVVAPPPGALAETREPRPAD